MRAPDLPTHDDDADFETYAQVVLDECPLADATDLIVVGQSMGAFTAPLVAQQRDAALLVLVAPMIPAPHESPAEWGTTVGHAEAVEKAAREQGFDPTFDPLTTLMHDLPRGVVDELVSEGEPQQSGAIFSKRFPLAAWPPIATRVVAGTEDRMFPLPLVQRLVRERLPPQTRIDEIPSGHLMAFARPVELADLLLGYAQTTAANASRDTAG